MRRERQSETERDREKARERERARARARQREREKRDRRETEERKRRRESAERGGESACARENKREGMKPGKILFIYFYTREKRKGGRAREHKRGKIHNRERRRERETGIAIRGHSPCTSDRPELGRSPTARGWWGQGWREWEGGEEGSIRVS